MARALTFVGLIAAVSAARFAVERALIRLAPPHVAGVVLAVAVSVLIGASVGVALDRLLRPAESRWLRAAGYGALGWALGYLCGALLYFLLPAVPVRITPSCGLARHLGELSPVLNPAA